MIMQSKYSFPPSFGAYWYSHSDTEACLKPWFTPVGPILQFRILGFNPSGAVYSPNSPTFLLVVLMESKSKIPLSNISQCCFGIREKRVCLFCILWLWVIWGHIAIKRGGELVSKAHSVLRFQVNYMSQTCKNWKVIYGKSNFPHGKQFCSSGCLCPTNLTDMHICYVLFSSFIFSWNFVHPLFSLCRLLHCQLIHPPPSLQLSHFCYDLGVCCSLKIGKGGECHPPIIPRIWPVLCSAPPWPDCATSFYLVSLTMSFKPSSIFQPCLYGISNYLGWGGYTPSSSLLPHPCLSFPSGV